MAKHALFRLVNSRLLQSVLLTPALAPAAGLIPSVDEIIFWAVYYLGKLIDTALLFAVRVAILFGVMINALIVFIRDTLLVEAMTLMFKAIGVEQGSIGGIFILFFVGSIILAGIGYIATILYPNTRLVNLRNVFVNTVIALLLVQSAFSLLVTLEKFRMDVYEMVNSQVYVFIADKGWLTPNASSLGIDISPLISPLETPNPAVDAFIPSESGEGSPGGFGAASMSGADLLAGFIGIVDRDQVAEKNSSGKLKVFPDKFTSTYFPDVPGELNSTSVKEYINNYILPGLVHSGIAFLLIIPVTLETVTILVLALTGFILFLSLPLALIFSFFTKTEGYLSSVATKYLQLVFLTISMGIIFPLLIGICMAVAGYVGYLIGGSILWLAGLMYVWKPAMDALDSVVSGATQAAGFGSMSGSITDAAGKMGGLAAGAIGAAAGIPGGLASLGIGALKTYGKTMTTAAKVGAVGYGLGRALTAQGELRAAEQISDPAERELVKADAEKKKQQGLNTAALVGGNLLGKTTGANWIAAAASLAKSEKRMSFKDTMSYADTGDALVSGISTSAQGGVFSVMYAADRLKNKAMSNMEEAKAKQGEPGKGEKPGGQKPMSPVKNAMKDAENQFAAAQAAGLLDEDQKPETGIPGNGKAGGNAPTPGGQPPVTPADPNAKGPSMPPGVGPDGKPLETPAAAGQINGQDGKAQATPAGAPPVVQAEMKAADVAGAANMPAGAKVSVEGQVQPGEVKAGDVKVTGAPQPVTAEVKAGDAVIDNLPAGAKVSAEGQAQPVSAEVKPGEVKVTGAPQPVTAEVKAGDAVIDNLPAGAKVSVEGQAQPVSAEVKPGEVKVAGAPQPVTAEVQPGDVNLPAGAVQVQGQVQPGEVKVAGAPQPVIADVKPSEPVQTNLPAGSVQDAVQPAAPQGEPSARASASSSPSQPTPPAEVRVEPPASQPAARVETRQEARPADTPAPAPAAASQPASPYRRGPASPPENVPARSSEPQPPAQTPPSYRRGTAPSSSPQDAPAPQPPAQTPPARRRTAQAAGPQEAPVEQPARRREERAKQPEREKRQPAPKNEPRQEDRSETPAESAEPIYGDDTWLNRARQAAEIPSTEGPSIEEGLNIHEQVKRLDVIREHLTDRSERYDPVNGIPGAEDALEALFRYTRDLESLRDDSISTDELRERYERMREAVEHYGAYKTGDNEIPGAQETLDELARMIKARETAEAAQSDDLDGLPDAPDASAFFEEDNGADDSILDWLFASNRKQPDSGLDEDDLGGVR